jgi:hypothetical protein
MCLGADIPDGAPHFGKFRRGQGVFLHDFQDVVG